MLWALVPSQDYNSMSASACCRSGIDGYAILDGALVARRLADIVYVVLFMFSMGPMHS